MSTPSDPKLEVAEASERETLPPPSSAARHSVPPSSRSPSSSRAFGSRRPEVSRAIRPASMLALIAFSIAMAWVLGRGQGFWQPVPPRANWGGATWIGYPGGSPVLYLRKRVVLAERPTHAWLTVASIDELSVYVNGRSVGHEEYIGARPSVALDVTRLLVPGANVIAIQAKTSTNLGPAQAIARLSWETAGARDSIVSDENFLAESREQRAGVGRLLFSDLDFPDLEWKRASAIEPGEKLRRTLVRPDLPVDVLAHGPRGSWIWQDDLVAPSAGFVRDVTIDAPFVREAWLGVATDGLYFLSVNGASFGPVSGSSGRMGVFNIAEYLKRGHNRIALEVATKSVPGRVLVSGHVEAPQGQLELSSDELWISVPSGRHAKLLADVAGERPALGELQNAPARSYWPRQLGQQLRYFAAILGLVLVLGMGFTTVLRARGESRGGAWLTYVQPFAAVTLLLLLVRLADWDQRFTVYYFYPVFLPGVLLTIVGVWLFLVAIPRRRPPERPLPDAPALSGGA